MADEIELVRIPVHSARSRALLEALADARRSYLGAPHCARVELLVNAAADEVLAIVHWVSEAAHQQAARGPHAPGFFRLVTQFASGPPQIAKYTAFPLAPP